MRSGHPRRRRRHDALMNKGYAMKKIGLLGGMAWPSTIDYYRAICQAANARFLEQGHGLPLPVPPITIDSVNIAETRALRGIDGEETGWEAYDAILRGVFARLEGAGCDIAAMASNTPHARLHAIRDDIGIPVISILDEAAKAAAVTGMSRALVLGTSVTMRGTHYPAALRAQGIDALPRLPDPEIDAIQRLIDTEFHAGATAKGREVLLGACKRYGGAESGIVVLLACTELPLAFEDNQDDVVFRRDGFVFVNTAAAHVQGILDAAMGDDRGR